MYDDIDLHDDISEILVTEEEIRSKIVELGEQIARDYQGKNLLLLGTLKGAVPFIGDLARTINRAPIQCTKTFIWKSTTWRFPVMATVHTPAE